MDDERMSGDLVEPLVGVVGRHGCGLVQVAERFGGRAQAVADVDSDALGT
jgi:hypothetical protein